MPMNSRCCAAVQVTGLVDQGAPVDNGYVLLHIRMPHPLVTGFAGSTLWSALVVSANTGSFNKVGVCLRFHMRVQV